MLLRGRLKPHTFDLTVEKHGEVDLLVQAITLNAELEYVQTRLDLALFAIQDTAREYPVPVAVILDRSSGRNEEAIADSLHAFHELKASVVYEDEIPFWATTEADRLTMVG